MRSAYVLPARSCPGPKRQRLKRVVGRNPPEPRVSLGRVLMFYDYDWPNAEQNFSALWTSAQLCGGPRVLCYVSGGLPALAGSVDEILRARQLDPVSGLIAADAAWVFSRARLRSIHGTGEGGGGVAPNFWLGHLRLGLAYEKKGDFARALQELEERGKWTTIPAFWRYLPAPALRRTAGRGQENHQGDGRALQKHYVCAYGVATTYAALKPRVSFLLVKIPRPARRLLALDRRRPRVRSPSR